MRSIAKKLLKRVADASDFPTNTCPASRYVQMIGESLVRGQKFSALDEEPDDVGEALLATVAALWELRRANHAALLPPSPPSREDK